MRRIILCFLLLSGGLTATGCRVDWTEPPNRSKVSELSDPIRFVGRGFAGAEFKIQAWIDGEGWDTERIATVDPNGNFDETVHFEGKHWNNGPPDFCNELDVRFYYEPNPITPDGFVFANPNDRARLFFLWCH